MYHVTLDLIGSCILMLPLTSLGIITHCCIGSCIMSPMTSLGHVFLCHPLQLGSHSSLFHLMKFVSVSAFYAECYNKHISLNGYIWTKSKFLGLSIGVHMIGQAVISVLDHEEEYILTFPNGYGRWETEF